MKYSAVGEWSRGYCRFRKERTANESTSQSYKSSGWFLLKRELRVSRKDQGAD